MKPHTHALLLALVAVGTGLMFLDQPKFGDDFTYWYHSFNLHEQGLSAWNKDSFHKLRWPVWGVCWVAQAIGGPGLANYYATPFLYLALGAMAAFTVGWKIFHRPGPAWACGLAFLFHPLVDSLVARPMPDVNEGVFGAGAVLAWWALMQAKGRGPITLWSAATGACLFLAQENRLTGVFLIPLLGCLTLLFCRQRWLRLLGPLTCYAVLLAGQMAFYQWKFDDPLHFIHAHQGAKGKKGTDSVAIWMLWALPFRFLDSLSKGSVLMPIYAVFAAAGFYFGWKKHGAFGRVIVAWFVLLYLAYACAPQKIWDSEIGRFDFHPMLRDADRFLAALAIPYSVLAVFGLRGLLELAHTRWRRFDLLRLTGRHRLLTGSLVFGLLVLLSGQPVGNRDFYNLAYVTVLRDHMRTIPLGTRVFTHHQARALAYLVDATAAQRIQWDAPKKWIMDREPELEAAAAMADEFWYVRKLALLRSFKDTKERGVAAQAPLASYFDTPERDWRLIQVLAKDDTPDVVLYRRRTTHTPPAIIFTADAPEFRTLLPALPYEWEKGRTNDTVETDWPLPASLRGKLVRVELEATSDSAEPFGATVAFIVNGKAQPPYMLKPYLYKDGGKQFVCLSIPNEATSCRARIRFSKDAKPVRVTGFRVVADSP